MSQQKRIIFNCETGEQQEEDLPSEEIESLLPFIEPFEINK